MSSCSSCGSASLLSACNLIPGSNSIKMVIHINYLHAGRPGFFLGLAIDK